VAQAWYAAGAGRGAEPPETGEIGALIVSGDEAAYDPRVIGLAERARFVLTSAMFPSELTGWSHLVLPGTSYLERDGTTISLEGRPQRQRRAVSPPWEDELVWLSALCARFGVEDVGPWPDVSALTDPAPLPPPATRTRVTAQTVAPLPGGEPGLEVVRYRALFGGPAVERVPELEFQRPKPEVELAASDARARGIEAGDQVTVSSNGTSRELHARLNRRLRSGVVRIADEHARGLSHRVEVTPR
jgi:anaerobic selenocysteine-containing dehydrogenase